MTTLTRATRTDGDTNVKTYSLRIRLDWEEVSRSRFPFPLQSYIDEALHRLEVDLERHHDRFIDAATQAHWEAFSSTLSRQVTVRVWVELKGMSDAERRIASRIWHAGRKAGAQAYTQRPYCPPIFISPWE